MIFRIGSKPIRTVIRWQCFAAIIFAVVAGLLSGIHAAISALLGGMVCVVGALGFALVISLGKTGSAGETLRTALRAEAVKVGLIVLLLYLVLATYKDVVAIEFIGSFIVSVVIFATAIMVPEQTSNRTE
jgi:ATP synthase protein I